MVPLLIGIYNCLTLSQIVTFYVIYDTLYNNPSYSRILIGSRL